MFGCRPERVLAHQVTTGDTQHLATLEPLEGVETPFGVGVVCEQGLQLGVVIDQVRRGPIQLAL